MNAVESAVRKRYAAGAKSTEPRLCCPIDYKAEYLEVIPRDVIDRAFSDAVKPLFLSLLPL